MMMDIFFLIKSHFFQLIFFVQIADNYCYIIQLFYFPVNVALRFTKIFNISFDPICLTSMMLKTKIVSSSATRALLLMHYIYSEKEKYTLIIERLPPNLIRTRART